MSKSFFLVQIEKQVNFDQIQTQHQNELSFSSESTQIKQRFIPILYNFNF